MNASERGSKHVCPDCGTKYYDLRKDVVTCPKCGAKPAPSKLPRTGQPSRRSGSVKFGR